MPQTLGFMVIDGEKVLVLCRQIGTYSRQFKLRTSGQDGNEFSDEANYLTEHYPEAVAWLKSGEVIVI